MKVAGIIAEYNPFHNGHMYHINRTRMLCQATHVVCVMSGDYVQRGDIAAVDKYERTAAALKGGADLIIELPAVYALASAERFACSAIGMLNMLGCVDVLSFGSESGDVELLRSAAACAQDADRTALGQYLKSGFSYPAALSKTLSDNGASPEILTALSNSNDILGIEYIRALLRLNSGIQPFAIKRHGPKHDGKNKKNGFLSAKEIRERAARRLDVSEFLPYNIGEAAEISRIETAILAKLRTLGKEELAKLPDISNGTENRIYRAVRAAISLDQLYRAIKSKRSTLSGARRLVLCAFIGVTKQLADEPPAYLRVLGMNDRGKEILSAAKCPIPIDTSLSALAGKSEAAARQAEFQSTAHDLYVLGYENKRPCGGEYNAKPIILKQEDI